MLIGQKLIVYILHANVNWANQNYQIESSISVMHCRKVRNYVVAGNVYKY